MGVLVLLLAAPALAQDLQGFQPVAPPDISPYERGPQPHQGYFFSIDELYWSISRPKVRKIGGEGARTVVTFLDSVILPEPSPIGTTDFNPQFVDQTSTQDTSRLTSKFVGGERIEFGRVEDGRGWMLSLFKLRDQNQGFDAGTSDVFLNDPTTVTEVSFFGITTHGLLFGRVLGNPGRIVTSINAGPPPTNVFGPADFLGPLPVTFDSLHVENRVRTWSVEMSYLGRLKPFHYGGNFEWFLGARYIELDEDFSVSASGGALDASNWTNRTQNHIVGPQLGARYFKQIDRLIISTEGRFLAGYNRQNIALEGQFGSNIVIGAVENPNGWPGGGFDTHASKDDFSGVAELRAELRYVVTRNIDVRVGWNGMWLGHIARPNGLIVYQVPTMDIDLSNRRQDVFIHGINVGVDFNR
jgi:hypothetical protein